MAAAPAKQTAVVNLYLALFDRAPDAAGFEFWVQALENGVSLAAITSSFLTSPEARTIYPASQSAEQFVSSFYQAVFGRAVDASGLAFWTGVLNAAGGSASDAARAKLVAQIVSIVSAPLATKPADLSDAQYAQTVADRDLFARKVAAGLDFAINLKSNDLTLAKQLIATLEAPVSPEPPAPPVVVPGQTFLLTTSTDTPTGGAGDDTFDGRFTSGNQLLGNLDRLDGGAGIDTLYATILLSTGTPTFTNIEHVVLNSINANAVLDLRNATGFTKVEFAGSNATGKADYTQHAALSVVDQNADVYFRASKATDVSLTLKNVSTAGARSLVSVNNTVNPADAAGITHNIVMSNAHVRLQASGTVPVVTMHVAATGTNSLQMATGTDSIQTLTVTGTGYVDFTDPTNGLASMLFGLTTFTAGDGGVKVKIDQAASGSVNVTTGAGRDMIDVRGPSVAAVRVGAGDDVVTLLAGALPAGATISLGDGDDSLIVTGDLSGASVDGGAGRDTLHLNTSVAVNGIAAVQGFEVLSVGASGTVVDVANVGSINEFAATGTGTTGFINANNSSKFSIEIGLDASAVSITNATGQTATDITVMNSSLPGAVKTLGTLTPSGATAVSLTSTALSLSAKNVITTLANDDNSVITIKGATDLTITNALAATTVGSKVDASAFTGKLSITGSGKSDTIIGGAGDDRIQGGAGADVLTGGNGNDRFHYTSMGESRNGIFGSGDYATDNLDRILDFVGRGSGGGDQIVLGASAISGLTLNATTTFDVFQKQVFVAESFQDIYANLTTGITNSTSSTVQVYDVTVGGGDVAGRYVIINDGSATLTVSDFIISIAGGSAPLEASDFAFGTL